MMYNNTLWCHDRAHAGSLWERTVLGYLIWVAYTLHPRAVQFGCLVIAIRVHILSYRTKATVRITPWAHVSFVDVSLWAGSLVCVGIVLVARPDWPDTSRQLLFSSWHQPRILNRAVRFNSTQTKNAILGRPILYTTTTTTTTQRGWCIETFVSILVQSQSRKSLPGSDGM